MAYFIFLTLIQIWLLFGLVLPSASGFWYGDPSMYTLGIFLSMNDTIQVNRYDAEIGDFGGVPLDQQPGCYYPVSPDEACNGSLIAPSQPCPNTDYPVYAIVSRGTCHFDQKAFNVQEKNYSGVFIVNNDAQFQRPHGDGGLSSEVKIPVFMVRHRCGYDLRYKYLAGKGYYFMLQQDSFNLFKYLWPFVGILAVCFLILLTAVLVKFARSRQRVARRRLSRRNLRKIPTKKFKKGDCYDCCPICLEDFEESDKLRVLPCNHAYHCACVDPWLTKNRKVCPVCKRKVLPGKSGDGSSESDSEGRRASEFENRPLLPDDDGDERTSVGNSTFYSSYQSLNESNIVPGFVVAPNDDDYDNAIPGAGGGGDGGASTSSSYMGTLTSSSDSDSPVLHTPLGSPQPSRWRQFLAFFRGTQQHQLSADASRAANSASPDQIIVPGYRMIDESQAAPGRRSRRPRKLRPLNSDTNRERNADQRNPSTSNNRCAGYDNMTYVNEDNEAEPPVEEVEVRRVPRRTRHPATVGAVKGGRPVRPPPPTPLQDNGEDVVPDGVVPTGGRSADTRQPSGRIRGDSSRDQATVIRGDGGHPGQAARGSAVRGAGRRRGTSSLGARSAPADLPAVSHSQDSSEEDGSDYSIEAYESPIDMDSDMELGDDGQPYVGEEASSFYGVKPGGSVLPTRERIV